MGPNHTSETCFTCFKKPTHFHKISDYDEDLKLNIHYIICQHFWFKEDDLQGAIVCETCWEKMDQFHQFYLDVKKLHENREGASLSMFIKQEEITIEEAQLQENCTDTSAENQKLFDKVDCKLEFAEECDDLPKMEEPAEVFMKPSKKRRYTGLLPNQRVVKRKNPHSLKIPTPEERQAEDDFIKQHMRYICDACNIEFENFRAIKNHRMEKHNNNTVVCCGSQHRTRSMLYQHVQSLLNPNAFKCEICGKLFKFKHSYVHHKELYHAAEKDLVFQCNQCSKSFIKEGLLKSHMVEHETLENEKAKCEFCDKCFHNESSLNDHVKVVHKKPMDFICEVCSEGFSLRRMLLEHQKTHKLTAEQLKKQCPVCNKWYSNHTNLLQHMPLHKEGDWKCEVCGHVAGNILSLKRHMSSKHEPVRKRYECGQCDKAYTRSLNLKEHVAFAHTGEHLYQCQDCDKKFFFSGTLCSHRKKDHP